MYLDAADFEFDVLFARSSSVLLVMAIGIAGSFLPGWFLARRVETDGLTRLLLASLLSNMLTGGVEMVRYACRLPGWVTVAVIAICAAVSLAAFVRRPREIPLSALLFLAGIVFVLTGYSSRIFSYTWGYWDWYEHYARAMLFLNDLPENTPIGDYLLPARGPLFNATGAALMRLGPMQDFFAWQIIAVTLNSLVALPLALLLRDLARLPEHVALIVAALVLITAPFFVYQSVFGWSKMYTAGWILASVHMYRKGLTTQSRELTAYGLAALPMGFLAHYLTAGYAIFILGDFVWRFRARPAELFQRSAMPVMSALLAVGWIGYLSGSLGVERTLTANTTFGSSYAQSVSGGRSPEYAAVYAYNLTANLLPRPPAVSDGPEPLVRLRAYGPRELEAVGMMPGRRPPPGTYSGVFGVLRLTGVFVLLAVLAMQALPKHRLSSVQLGTPSGRFWCLFFTVGLAVNLLPIRWYCPHGTFEQNLHGYALLMIVITAAALHRAAARFAVACAAVVLIDWSCQTWILLRMQEPPAVLAWQVDNEAVGAVVNNVIGYKWAWENFRLKSSNQIEFIRDVVGPSIEWIFPFLMMCGAICLAAAAKAALRDRSNGQIDQSIHPAG